MADIVDRRKYLLFSQLWVFIAAAGLAAGDIVVAAAGAPVRDVSNLTAVVQRQAPGTWLPLTVKRDEGTAELVAKFPAAPPME